MKIFHQPKVGDFDVPPHKQQVLWLDVEMLQVVLLGQIVEGIGRVAQVVQQFLAIDARFAVIAAMAVMIAQTAIGEFHHDQQAAVDNLEPLERQQEGMANRFYLFERAELACSMRLIGAAVDDFNRLNEPSWGAGTPHLTIPTRTNAIEQGIAWKFKFRGGDSGHGFTAGCEDPAVAVK